VRFHLRNIPTRLTTGAFIVHSGLEKWKGGEDEAHGVHEMAVSAYPFLRKVRSTTFLKALAVAEVGVGAALLVPLVPNRIAGAMLSGFSGALMGLYWRAPKLRQEDSIWPTHDGVGISKDVWMLGIGTSLMLERNSKR
jgi:hypothetical protein